MLTLDALHHENNDVIKGIFVVDLNILICIIENLNIRMSTAIGREC